MKANVQQLTFLPIVATAVHQDQMGYALMVSLPLVPMAANQFNANVKDLLIQPFAAISVNQILQTNA
jgi:hypothetical protein